MNISNTYLTSILPKLLRSQHLIPQLESNSNIYTYADLSDMFKQWHTNYILTTPIYHIAKQILQPYVLTDINFIILINYHQMSSGIIHCRGEVFNISLFLNQIIPLKLDSQLMSSQISYITLNIYKLTTLQCTPSLLDWQ